MTWIKTIPVDQADETLRRCYEAIMAFYPPEYREEVASLHGPTEAATASPSLTVSFPKRCGTPCPPLAFCSTRNCRCRDDSTR